MIPATVGTGFERISGSTAPIPSDGLPRPSMPALTGLWRDITSRRRSFPIADFRASRSISFTVGILLRDQLVEMIDTRHELVKIAALIDWVVFAPEGAGLFRSSVGGPATPIRLGAGLFYLQHPFRLSDKAVAELWAENPYWQHFCGEVFFRHRPPIDASSMTDWQSLRGDVYLTACARIASGRRARCPTRCRSDRSPRTSE